MYYNPLLDNNSLTAVYATCQGDKKNAEIIGANNITTI